MCKANLGVYPLEPRQTFGLPSSSGGEQLCRVRQPIHTTVLAVSGSRGLKVGGTAFVITSQLIRAAVGGLELPENIVPQ